MKYNNFGNTDLKVSELGLGCQSMGGGLYYRDDNEFIKTLEKLKTQGKIRYYGITCLTVDDAILCLKFPNISSLQVAISLIDQEAITKLLPLVQEKNLGLISRHPRAIGLFTKNKDDIMGDSAVFSKEEFEIRKKKAAKFQFLVKENRTIAQASIQFILQLNGISVTLPRAVNRDELDENVGSLTAAPLTNDELKKIYSLSN